MKVKLLKALRKRFTFYPRQVERKELPFCKVLDHELKMIRYEKFEDFVDEVLYNFIYSNDSYSSLMLKRDYNRALRKLKKQ